MIINLIPDMIPDDDDPGCWGYNDSCGNLRLPGEELCADCAKARLDAESPRIPR